jgi:hypothetical protein
MDTQKKCKICNEVKSLDEFYKSQRGLRCKTCVLNSTREYKRSKRKDSEFRKIEGQKQKERRVRLWQNTLINDSKKRGYECTLTIGDVNELYEKQNGLCHWFKIPLIPSNKPKHPQQPSLDRLDRNKGYTKDNIVLCCYSSNIGRNENDLETWTEFVQLLNLK